MKHFLKPTNDFVFKKIFGGDNERDIPIGFLNAVLDFSGENAIEEIETVNFDRLPKIEAKQDAVLDVKAKDKKGRTFIVEMQVMRNHDFFKRSLYRAAQVYTSQIYYDELKKVYFVGILDFSGMKGEKYLSSHLILNKKSMADEVGDFEFRFVELPKFKKGIGDLENAVEKWVYFLKHAHECGEIPRELRSEEVFARAFRIAEASGWSPEELELYEKRQPFLREQEDLRKTAERTGLEKP